MRKLKSWDSIIVFTIHSVSEPSRYKSRAASGQQIFFHALKGEQPLLSPKRARVNDYIFLFFWYFKTFQQFELHSCDLHKQIKTYLSNDEESKIGCKIQNLELRHKHTHTAHTDTKRNERPQNTIF